MTYTAAVITVSDKGFAGLREDTSGPALVRALESFGFEVVHAALVPDEPADISAELVRCCDELDAALVLTTGGTGFSPRDRTPEATRAVILRDAPGIAELMRAQSMRLTPNGCLSRGVSGIRGGTLVVNLPGSERAAGECLAAVIVPVLHGLKMLRGGGGECASKKEGQVVDVCSSDRKGVAKTPRESVTLVPHHGVFGDAHAGDWHRQVSLLAVESVRALSDKTGREFAHGAFAENILTRGLCLRELPVGTLVRVGGAVLRITQIGKECHEGCEIKKLTGDCVMPREGVFAEVLTGAELRPGETIEEV